jgi:hypothetical protein
MSDNTAMVLMLVLSMMWNAVLLAGTIYTIIVLGASWWLLLLACFFVIWPKMCEDLI